MYKSIVILNWAFFTLLCRHNKCLILIWEQYVVLKVNDLLYYIYVAKTKQNLSVRRCQINHTVCPRKRYLGFMSKRFDALCLLQMVDVQQLIIPKYYKWWGSLVLIQICSPGVRKLLNDLTQKLTRNICVNIEIRSYL